MFLEVTPYGLEDRGEEWKLKQKKQQGLNMYHKSAQRGIWPSTANRLYENTQILVCVQNLKQNI